MREQLVAEARRRVRSSWLKRGASRGRARLGRRHPRPRRADHRLRPPGADVQAAHPDAARPRPAQARCCSHPERPIQLVIAGKSHPADETGKQLIQQMVQFADDPEVRHRIVFLPNYDIAMAQYLYPGCDVWLNNPLRPFEACGTSGMKAALNGGLNLSILDGWWDEWFDGENGWAIPTADGVEDPERRDDLEAAALYDLIENQVAPRFYDRDDDRPAAALDLAMMTHTLHDARPEGPGQPHGARLHRAALRARGRAPGWALNGADVRRCPRPRGLQGQGARGLAERAVDHVESSGVSDSPAGRRHAARARLRLARTGSTPDDVEVQVVHGRVNDADELRDVERRAAGPRRVLRGRPAPVRGRPRRCARTGVVRLHRAGAAAARRPGQHAPSSAWSPTPDADRPTRPRPRPGVRALRRRRRPCSGPRTARQAGRRTTRGRPRASAWSTRVAAAYRRGRAARRRCPRAARTPSTQGAAGQRDLGSSGPPPCRTTSSERSSTVRRRRGTSAACGVPGRPSGRRPSAGRRRRTRPGRSCRPSWRGLAGEELRAGAAPACSRRSRERGAGSSRAGPPASGSRSQSSQRDLVVLAVGVVVAALGAAQLVAGVEHRHAGRQQQGAEQVADRPARAAPAIVRVVGRALDAVVPRPVVVAAVAVALAVGLVVLVVVRRQVGEREAVVRGDEVDRGDRARGRGAPNRSCDPASRVASSRTPWPVLAVGLARARRAARRSARASR